MEPCNKVNFYHENDVNTVIYNIRQEGILFTMSIEEIVKTFLSRCLCDDFFVSPFNKMRSDYIEATDKTDKDAVPDKSSEFCMYIFETHFGYRHEPRETLIIYSERAIKDWNELDGRIKGINEEIDKLKRENDTKANQEWLPILHYYLKHTSIALEEVINFLKKEIHDYVLHRCSTGLFAYFNGEPYHYYMSAQAYDIKPPSMLSNKFRFSGQQKEINDLYDNNQESFKVFLRKYIEDNAILFIIRRTYNNNYFFSKRQELIEEALESYENGKYILFSSACFIIVEGILHDICLELGIPESKVLGAGFQPKIDKIHDDYKLDLDYQYYSFKFRVLRNKVVHGTAEAGELREIADLLLLDLIDMIEVTKSNRILFNAKIFFLDSGLKDTPDRYEYVAGYIILSDTKIPYSTTHLTESHEKILALLQEDSFWAHVDKLCESRFSYERGVGIQLLEKISRLKIADLTEKISARFRKYKDVKDKFDLEIYLKSILQYTYY